MKRTHNLLITTLTLFMLTSCNPNRIYYSFQTIENTAWNKDSVLIYDFEIIDTTQQYNLYLDLRHFDSYPYQNLWLFIDTQNPADSTQQKDTVEYYLADKYGKWFGHGAGTMSELPLLYKEKVTFPNSGNYKISIKQGMRTSILKGINDVGLRIEYAK